MKSNIYRALALLMCLTLIITAFAGCKGKGGDSGSENATKAADAWSQGVPTDKVDLSADELTALVKEALGTEASAFKGDLSGLTPVQLSKVQTLAGEKGYFYEVGKDGKISIKKAVTLVNIADTGVVSLVKEALGDEAKNFDGNLSSLSNAQLEKVKAAAEKKGFYLENDASGKPEIKKESVVNTATKDDQKEVNKIVKDVLGRDAKNFDGNTDKLDKEKKEELESKLAEKNYTPEEAIQIINTDYDAPQTEKPTKPTTQKSNGNANRTGSDAKGGGSNTPGKAGKDDSDHGNLSTTSQMLGKEIVKSFKQVSMSGFRNGKSSLSACEATDDGGMIATGNNVSEDTSANIVKYKDDGKIDWKDELKCKNSNIYFEDVTVLSDGRIVAVGYTQKDGVNEYSPTYLSSKPDGRSSDFDCMIAVYTAKGKLDKLLCFGGSMPDRLFSVVQCTDGGIAVGGTTQSTDGDFSAISKVSSGGQTSAIIMKFTDASLSAIAWAKSTSSSKYTCVAGLAASPDGSVFAAYDIMMADLEFASIADADIGSEKTLVVKYSSAGENLWQKTICSSQRSLFKDIVANDDGGCTVAGKYTSAPPREDNNYGCLGTFENVYNGGNAGSADGAVIRLSSTGNITWLTTFVGFNIDEIEAIVKTPTGYAVAGCSNSVNRDFTNMPSAGDYDCFIYALNANGGKQAVYGYGGTSADRLNAICLLNDGTIGGCGSTSSSDGSFAELSPAGSSANAASYAVKFSMETT